MDESFVFRQSHEMAAAGWQDQMQKLKEQHYMQVNDLRSLLEDQKNESEDREKMFT